MQDEKDEIDERLNAPGLANEARHVVVDAGFRG